MRTTALAIAATVASLSVPATAATIDLETAAATVEIGETFDVDFLFSGMGATLAGFDAVLDFSADLFTFVEAEFATALGDTTGQNLVDPFDADTLQITAFSNDDATTLAGLQVDDFAAVTLTFRAISVGTGTFDLDPAQGGFFDADFFDIETAFGEVSSTVQVIAPAPIPLPASGLLLLAGLGGLAMRRRG